MRRYNRVIPCGIWIYFWGKSVAQFNWCKRIMAVREHHEGLLCNESATSHNSIRSIRAIFPYQRTKSIKQINESSAYFRKNSTTNTHEMNQLKINCNPKKELKQLKPQLQSHDLCLTVLPKKNKTFHTVFFSFVWIKFASKRKKGTHTWPDRLQNLLAKNAK